MKTIVITGASSGIGAYLLGQFYKRGYRCVLNYRQSDHAAEEIVQSLVDNERRVLKVRADISEPSGVRQLFKQTEKAFGQADILINNAGLNIDKPFLELSAEDWLRVLHTNLSGPFFCSQEFARRYQGESGHIINVGASTAFKGRKNGANYCPSKAGVVNLTKCLALELAPVISVNCLIPGYIDTREVRERYDLDNPEKCRKLVELIPCQRLGSAEDIFKTIRFIVEEATYTTGQNFFVNGGHFMY